MTGTNKPFPGRFFRGLWLFIDGTRKVVLNVIFFTLLTLFVLTVIKSAEQLLVQPQTALLLNPQGVVVEEYSGTPLDQAFQQATAEARSETRLRDLVEAIRRAKDDRHIVRLVIDPSDLWHVGMAALLELEAAVADFRTSGKPVIALADNLGQQQYYLAALADEIWLHPDGMVWIDGFAAYRNYFREALDKLEVGVNLFRAGNYKSAGEPFVRNDMSDEDREASLFWLGSLWQQYLESVSRLRGIPLVDLSKAVNDFADRLEAAQGDFAQLALDMGLVDRVMGLPEAHQELAGLGAAGQDGRGFRQVGFLDYLSLTGESHAAGTKPKVMILVAQGDILRGHQPPGVIGADSFAERLRAIARDERARAVVLRLDSPGGEAFASEKLRREVQALREQGITVVVSMGDVAASGAYWMAMAADEVWASPATLTGSIGVFGLFPTVDRTLGKLGIHTDGVGTTPLAGKLRLDLPLDEDLRRIFQVATEQTYSDFIQLVARSRGMSPEAVHKLAQGRVWSGLQAKERGLVDQTGTLAQAVDAAARIAGLGTDYRTEYSETETSAFERFLLDLTASTAARVGLAAPRPAWERTRLWQDLESELRFIGATGDGLSLAVHCLCSTP